MTSELVKPITCRRCSGTGYVKSHVHFAGAPGGCFKCAGTGIVEGDRATIAAAKARSERNRAARVRAHEGDHGHGVMTDAPAKERLRVREERHLAIHGLNLLEEHEPERFVKAVEAILAERMDVYPALVAYARAHRDA